MICEEFSDQFDVHYNNIMSNAAPGLNEYEKSVFLTKAQNEIVKNYFNPQGNKYKEGFDGSAKRQMDFSMLMSQIECDSASAEAFGYQVYDPRAKVYVLPQNILVSINESVIVMQDSLIKGVRQVVPISYDEYARLMSKPYKEPLKNQAWRLITGQDEELDNRPIVELIANNNDSKYSIKYKIRYVRRPKPIIVADLASVVGNVSIDGISTRTECELDPSIHEEILQRAVELAKASYASDQSGQAQLQNQITVGQRSE